MAFWNKNKSKDAGTYHILIEFADAPKNGDSDGTAVPSPNESVPQEDGSNGQEQARKAAKDKTNPALAMVQQMAGKVGKDALNNYGNITGDYITQQNLQAAISEVTAISGAIALGPKGIALYATDKVLQTYNYFTSLNRSAVEAEFRQQRVYASTEKS